MASSATPEPWRALFEEIAIPRLAGSRSCDQVVARLAGFLVRKGYHVQRERFDAGVERLAGASLFGLLLALGSAAAAALLLRGPIAPWPPHAALEIGVAGATVVVLTVYGLASGRSAARAASVANGGVIALLVLGGAVAAMVLLHGPIPGALRRPASVGRILAWLGAPGARGCAVLALAALLPAALAVQIANGCLNVRWVAGLLGYRFLGRSGNPDPYVVPAENLTAIRAGGDPRVWLVAHSDSKAQRNSLGMRMIAVWLAAAGVLLLTASGLLGALEPLRPALSAGTLLGAAFTVAGGTVIAAAGLRDGSPGAVDNATGVVAALKAAEDLGWRLDVGILITGAEELAMAGAREWVKRHRRGEVFVNFDGIDGEGRYVLWIHDGDAPGDARRLASGLRRRLGDRETWIPRFARAGMFVDGTVLSRAGLAGVTVQRGTFFGTTMVTHTRRDEPSRVVLEGAASAGRAAAAVVEEFLATSR